MTNRSISVRRPFMLDYGPYWEFWSPKGKTIVRLDRSFGPPDLAYSFWLLLEGDPSIKYIDPAPNKIRECVDGKWLSGASPICAVDRKEKAHYYGLAYHNRVTGKTASPRVLKSIDAQQAYASKIESTFAIVTDQLLRPCEQLISNWARMLPYVSERHNDSREVLEGIWDFALQTEHFSMGELESALAKQPAHNVRRALFRCVHHGTLAGDFQTRGLSAETRIWVPNGLCR